jgi:hypothetical protein
MKRKAMRHLGSGWNDRKTILLRDPSDDSYPFVKDDEAKLKRGWHVVEFAGHHLDCIKLKWRSFFAYLSMDGRRWDYANVYDDRGIIGFHDPWLFRDEADRLAELREQVSTFWHESIPETEQARFDVHCLISYDDIIEIDERGDDIASMPHVFAALKDGRPLRAAYRGILRAHGVTKEEIDAGRLDPPRVVEDPDLSDRIAMFPQGLRIVVSWRGCPARSTTS